jgi:hypothetical protein
MTKPLLRLGFTDYFQTMDEFFLDTLSKSFEIVRDDSNPDYLIFADETFGSNNLNYKNCIKIFFTGENRRPWNYQCHHAISFDHMDGPQFYRLPLYVLDNNVYTKKLGLPDIREVKRTATASDKTGFCSFVVRNGGCAERNNIFHTISKYKIVDSAGPLFNNMGDILSKGHWHTAKLNFIGSRKFNICYENSSYPGYVTEKLFQALYTNTIPIYWGSPTVELDFNPKAYISRHDFSSDEDMLEKIIELDTDDTKYNEMVQQPILNPRNTRFDMDHFNKWFINNVYKGIR